MDILNVQQFSPAQLYYNTRDKLEAHVFARSQALFEENRARRRALAAARDAEAHTEGLRRRFIEGMGGLPDLTHPLNPCVTGKLRQEGFSIENVIFESRPGVYVTANLYLPDGIEEPRGAVLFTAGHSTDGKQYANYQVACRALALAGLVVLSTDPVSQGERRSYMRGDEHMMEYPIYEHQYAGHQCMMIGHSPMRYFIGDLMRAVDYLQSRPEVDPERIGMTGCSGGGTMTAHMMVCDPRIRAAAPVCFVTSRESYLYAGGAQDAEQIWLSATAYGFDHEDALLCFAPKPLLIGAARYDFFPLEGTLDSFEGARRAWRLFGAEELVELHISDNEHGYSRASARAAAGFFAKHLLGREGVEIDTESLTPVDSRLLDCTRTGQAQSSLPGARFIFDENVDEYRRLRREHDGPGRPERLRAFLEERVLAGRSPAPLNTRLISRTLLNGMAVQPLLWFPQERLPCYGVLFTPDAPEGGPLPLVIALWQNGTDALTHHIYEIEALCRKGRAVLAADLSGMGKCAPHDLNSFAPGESDYGAVDRLAKDLLFLGDSLCALRVYELLRTAEMAAGLPGVDAGRISLYGSGRPALYARLASLLREDLTLLPAPEGFDRPSSMVESRYYENYDASSTLLPGLALYMD